MAHGDGVGSAPPPDWWEKLTELRERQAGCSASTVAAIDELRRWKKEQNGDIKSTKEEIGRVRKLMTGLLISVILLLAGVLVNVLVERSAPSISEVVRTEVETQLVPIVETVVENVLHRVP